MPLSLPFNLAQAFVQNDLSEGLYREILQHEMQSEDLEYYPVYTIRLPKPRPDGKGKCEYFEWENLPPLGVGNPVITLKEE